ncbi:ribosomal protein S3 [Anncaliia algerae PRA109]|uniref:40S ribosomal protein S3 n=2 Tax=Anncaliia algerae TaxID=723287 RepID=A0A059EYZ1_9MICR|nr:ribosomal protein S3 [Anncaliia algerae PRA109]KCZ80047.1 ribosomal protein S3 [Anncaliia algerae PRA339]CBH28921.1 40S ribosomal protein S3 [Anncaliia algerae]
MRKQNPLLVSHIQKGLMHAELDEFFSIELKEEGYGGMDIKLHEMPVQITIRVNKPEDVMGDKKSRLNLIKHLLMQRFPLLSSGVEINVEMIKNKGLCPMTQADFIRVKLFSGIPFRRAVHAAMKSIKDGGAQGCVIIISGKLKGQRAKSVKYQQGLMIHTGNDRKLFVKEAISTVLLKQGVIGIKVKIMLPYDPTGINGPSREICDKITIFEPKQN